MRGQRKAGAGARRGEDVAMANPEEVLMQLRNPGASAHTKRREAAAAAAEEEDAHHLQQQHHQQQQQQQQQQQPPQKQKQRQTQKQRQKQPKQKVARETERPEVDVGLGLEDTRPAKKSATQRGAKGSKIAKAAAGEQGGEDGHHGGAQLLVETAMLLAEAKQNATAEADMALVSLVESNAWTRHMLIKDIKSLDESIEDVRKELVAARRSLTDTRNDSNQWAEGEQEHSMVMNRLVDNTVDVISRLARLREDRDEKAKALASTERELSKARGDSDFGSQGLQPSVTWPSFQSPRLPANASGKKRKRNETFNCPGLELLANRIERCLIYDKERHLAYAETVALLHAIRGENVRPQGLVEDYRPPTNRFDIGGVRFVVNGRIISIYDGKRQQRVDVDNLVRVLSPKAHKPDCSTGVASKSGTKKKGAGSRATTSFTNGAGSIGSVNANILLEANTKAGGAGQGIDKNRNSALGTSQPQQMHHISSSSPLARNNSQGSGSPLAGLGGPMVFTTTPTAGGMKAPKAGAPKKGAGVAAEDEEEEDEDGNTSKTPRRRGARLGSRARTYDPEFKAMVLDMYDQLGENKSMTHLARQLNIPRPNISKWVKHADKIRELVRFRKGTREAIKIALDSNPGGDDANGAGGTSTGTMKKASASQRPRMDYVLD
ncbi:Hypothetical Protein FCC1311_070092 [Hondaea fermentalgiana]|uniref:Brinker DNA-binding domain-containing protein n=1 Tax=Hondaea fermentalgiana TaxID=2315210 RepID=A0A2R5GKE5_9STRA|nr:Hypothetical Protein FCC1311_070092 [Hondaea fermentalgiana]|eukprot:GBG30789.1 Hypothetical Protein FCC1311_070092 [Hondaea fermentalgiana]